MTKEQIINKIQEEYAKGNLKKANEYNKELCKIKKDEKQSRHNLLKLSSYIRRQCA